MTDERVEQQRETVEATREELRASVDQLGHVAQATRTDLVMRARRVAVPAAAAVAGVALAVVVLGARRRRRRTPLIELGPFAVHPRR